MLPNGNMPSCLYYNLDLLELNGLSADDIPTTWDEFVPWASSLTIWDGDALVQAGFSFSGDGVWLADAIRYQNGGWWFVDDSTCAWNQKETIDAYQFVLELFETKRLQDKAGLSSLDQFSQGQALTAFFPTSRHGFFLNQFPELNWGVMPTPTASIGGPYGRATAVSYTH